MVKKAQRTFILITMSILFVVFSVIFFSIHAVMNTAHNNYAENTLNDCYSAIQSLEEVYDKIVVIDGEIKSTFVDYSTPQTISLFNSAKSKSQFVKFGRIGTVFYKFYTSEVGSLDNVFIAVNLSKTFNALRNNSFTVLLHLSAIYLLIFILVWNLSHLVFKPIKNTLEKQKQFVSDASHELKTPITIISANTDVITKTEDNAQWIDNIKSQTERLNTLVQDLLSLAKIDEGNFKLSHSTFNLSNAVLETVLPFDALAYEKGKTFITDIDENISLIGDEISVKKVVNILVDNAIKHSSGQNIIKISLKKESNKAILTVYNSGSNVPSNKANKIFERFYRGDGSRARASGGSGLGLAIAKSISDANKWKLHAHSVYGECMTITLTMKNHK